MEIIKNWVKAVINLLLPSFFCHKSAFSGAQKIFVKKISPLCKKYTYLYCHSTKIQELNDCFLLLPNHMNSTLSNNTTSTKSFFGCNCVIFTLLLIVRHISFTTCQSVKYHYQTRCRVLLANKTPLVHLNTFNINNFYINQ